MEGAGNTPPESGAPFVNLPVVSETGATQASAAGDDAGLAEEDLFGSDVEEDDRPAPLAPSAPVASAPATVARGEVETAEDLFGSDPGDDELDERALFGSDDEGGELDERALFGSDDEGDATAKAQAGRASAPPRSPGAMSDMMSEMDEREIFGEVSDDEPEKVEDVVVRRRPAPGPDREFVSLRLPNVLSIEKAAYNADSIPQTLLEGFKGFKNTLNKQSSRLLNPENCVRWRFKKGPDGHILTDDDGRPQYETNSRIVEWEDGSKTLFVGSECFEISEIDDRIVIFEENSQDVHVCHTTAGKRFYVTPRDLESTTHEMLKRTQYHKFEANRRSILMSQEEQDAHQALLQIQADHREKQRKDEQRKRALEPSEGAVMNRAFLEDLDEDAGVGPNLQEIKQSAKRLRGT
mmetsp:Transcript_51096/g.100931  ORF Transcript_51096/g.100931 Transcript_51096/m.100931 type:complete len:409 (+) Transcript_51096:134-1360(+)